MASRRKRSGKAHGGGGARNPRSLANLKRQGPAAPIGNAYRMTHGARSELLVANVEDEVRELMDALADAAPVRDQAGGLPVHDVVAVEQAARALRRWRHISQWCDTFGRLTEQGEVKPASRYELEAERALHRALSVLGMNPDARVRLGLNLARAAEFDLAAYWAQSDPIEGEAVDD
jgi:hypothetical protein